VRKARDGAGLLKLSALRSHRAIAALLLLAVAMAGAWSWLEHASGGGQELYKSEAVRIGDVTQAVSANGTINPVTLVNVGTQVSGTVSKLLADFNDRVKAGQILLELDPALLRAQVRQDEASLASAKAVRELAVANEARNRTLFAQEYISKQDLDTAMQVSKSASAQVELALAQLAKDRTNLSYSVIRSPVSGVVVNRAVDLGQTVAASFQTPTLFQIAQDLSNMQIDSSFAEADIGRIRVGQRVQFTVDAFPNRTFDAAVRQVRLNATTQQNVVTYDVVVGVSNPDQILMPGMTAYVNVIVATRQNVLLVPNAALRFRPEHEAARQGGTKKEAKADGMQATVYVLAQGALRAAPIRVGITDSRFTEVVSGDLKAGQQVVVGTVAPPDAQSPGTFRMRMF